MRVLLPEPLTPVTQVKYPRGMEASIVFKLWAEAPRRWSQSRGWKGRGACGDFFRSSLGDEMSSFGTCAWAKLDEVICTAESFLIVFDEDE